jgi:hypothetical protein
VQGLADAILTGVETRTSSPIYIRLDGVFESINTHDRMGTTGVAVTENPTALPRRSSVLAQILGK